MIRFQLTELDRQARRRHVLLEHALDPGQTRETAGLNLRENSDLAVRLEMTVAGAWEARIKIGNVLIASTHDSERPDFLLQPAEELPEAVTECVTCHGRLLRDWVGLTELTVEVTSTAHGPTVLRVPVSVTAGKIEQEAFEALCTELADYSASVLLDVYGKTFVGLELERRPGETAPVALLQRLRKTLDHLGSALRGIARQPAYRLKARRVREPVLVEQAVADLTLEEACLDPTIVVRLADRVRFREHVREEAAPHFDLPEHRLISGFLGFLGQQLGDLRGRLQQELWMRRERRAFRHRRTEPDVKTWWETEDLPRIEELQALLVSLEGMQRDLALLGRHAFLPPAAPLKQIPASTPLLRAHREYARLFAILRTHFQAFRVHLDDGYLLTRARAMPVLYEWWCVLQVLRILQVGLTQRSGDSAPGSPFRRLKEERERFLIEFSTDQVVDFEDEYGRLVRLRFQPCYRSLARSEGLAYGVLGPGEERTPDLTLEIFGAAQEAVPELIIVLDAKYSSDPHEKKLEEVGLKYGRIGIFQTGRLLSRQVWALAPGAPYARGRARWLWASSCTVDNVGFWSDQFDLGSCVTGVVQARPRMALTPTPLEALLHLILTRAGIAVRGSARV